MRAWMLFTAIRVLVFAVPFGVLYALSIPWWLAAMIAAAVGFCVSYIFLGPLRERVAHEFAEARAAAGRPGSDEDAEDAVPPAS